MMTTRGLNASFADFRRRNFYLKSRRCRYGFTNIAASSVYGLEFFSRKEIAL